MSSSPDVGAKIGKSLTDAPIGAMILGIAQGIADAQQALDMAMLRTAILMTGELVDADGNKTTSLIKFDGQEVSLLELGFTPTFYQFTETSIEVKIALSMSTADASQKATFESTAKADAEGGMRGLFSVGATVTANVSAVGAMYSSKYSYSAEGSSAVRTKVVPVPPPALLEQRLRRSLDKKFAERTKT